MIEYYNFHTQIADNWWERRAFLHNWRRIYASDGRWVPPHWPTLRRLLRATAQDLLPANLSIDNEQHEAHQHLARLAPCPIYSEALPRRSADAPSRRRDSVSGGAGGGLGSGMGAVFEEPVAAGILLHDARRRSPAGYLALPHFANSASALKNFLGALAEPLQQVGVRRIVTPVGLSPHLPGGVLQNYFQLTPPLHSAYNPPFLPEIAEQLLQPIQQAHLFQLPLAEFAPAPFAGANQQAPVHITPLDPTRLAVDLLPLLREATVNQLGFVPPDALEANFLLAWLGAWPLHGWVASIGKKGAQQPVGFVLLQGDFAQAMQRAGGGRNAAARTWLSWRVRRSAPSGRLLYGAVAREWRNRGIGTQLLSQALVDAKARGWQQLNVGPLTDAKPHDAGRGLVAKFGGEPRQQYTTYEGYI